MFRSLHTLWKRKKKREERQRSDKSVNLSYTPGVEFINVKIIDRHTSPFNIFKSFQKKKKKKIGDTSKGKEENL